MGLFTIPSGREEKFNFWFSAFLLTGMVLIAVYSFFYNIGKPEARILMQAIAGGAAVMGVTNTVLSANGSIWTFLFGLLDVICCSIVYFDSGVMGTFALHVLYFLPMQFVGFWQWRRRGAGDRVEDTDGHVHEAKVRARRLTSRQWLMVAAAFVVGTAAAIGILYAIDLAQLRSGRIEEIDMAKIFLDAALVVLNILGQVLLSLAFTEQWYLWILVNIVSILLWTNRLLSPEASGYTAVMLVKYIFYFLNSLNGLRIWLKLSKSQQIPHKSGCC